MNLVLALYMYVCNRYIHIYYIYKCKCIQLFVYDIRSDISVDFRILVCKHMN